ncbi:MAG: DUF3089 domain-containing protein [Pseudomonadota bacterium]|nr:DUF3089 domain-containing protein [Pseudomonadota bacterium]
MLLTALLLGAAATQPAPAAADYNQQQNWLCRPGRKDACSTDLDATVIAPDGRTRIERFRPARSPAVDCFYVYPTVSMDPGPNSDLVAGEEERRVIASQFARFGSACRTFAPVYRQVTLTALRSAMAGKPIEIDRTLGSRDVAAAFRHYLENDNRGRPFVLIGHSQGARMLEELVKSEIDGKPLQDQMLSAMLLGYNLEVPKERDVGGTFKSVPLCRSPQQTGCVISYVSFREESPPPQASRFGRSEARDRQIACTNPARLAGGGRAPLDAYLGTQGAGFSAAPPPPWISGGTTIRTPFVKVPGLLSGQCVSDASGSYLAVTVNADPADPRTDAIVGEVIAGGTVLPDWGLHLIDVSIAQGDLINLLRSQAAAKRGRLR